jgi:hypothetical protein
MEWILPHLRINTWSSIVDDDLYIMFPILLTVLRPVLCSVVELSTAPMPVCSLTKLTLVLYVFMIYFRCLNLSDKPFGCIAIYVGAPI